MKDEKNTAKEKVELDVESVKQMLNLYHSVGIANSYYTSGTTMYRLRAEHVTETAYAPNVKKAFEAAAKAIGETL